MLEYIDYSTLAGGEDLKFTYDGPGRRIMVQKGTATVTKGQVTDFSAVDTKKFVYLGGSVIRELDGDDNVLKEYFRGPDLGAGIGRIIYQEKGAAYYEYDAWGNTMTEAETSGVDNPYRCSTKEWDEKPGLYYFGARYYSPETGRWTQRDPSGVEEGLNLYLYVHNIASWLVDPWGLGATNPRPRGAAG